jgi:D-aspartate ligase
MPKIENIAAEKAGALVLGRDGGDASALGTVRSLGRHNIPVWVLTGKVKLAALSRYCIRSFRWPDSDEDLQLDFLLDLGKRYGLDGWTLFAIDDNHAALLARNRELLARYFRIPPPDWEVMRWAYDKRLTYELTARLGVSHPVTLCPRNRADVAAWQGDFPVILKPASKPKRNRFTRAKAWLANDRGELLKLYDEASGLLDSSLIMVQEMIVGGGQNQYSYAGLHADGKAMAYLTVRRLRQHPADFGIASCVEMVESSEVERSAQLLLEALSYTGLAELEFKYDPRHGTYKLLDFNPRIWFWHALASRAGVDFPYLLWRWMHNEPIDEIRARPHARWVHFRRDLPAAIREIRHRRLSAFSYLKSLTVTSQFAVMAKDDPLPALLEVPVMLAARCFSMKISRKKKGRIDHPSGLQSQPEKRGKNYN